MIAMDVVVLARVRMPSSLTHEPLLGLRDIIGTERGHIDWELG